LRLDGLPLTFSRLAAPSFCCKIEFRTLFVPNSDFQPPALHTPPALVAVVDDDPDILELLSFHLKKAAMKVRQFADAEGFYRFLQKDTPDLVVLDLMLPDSDGIEVCRFLRRENHFSAVPIIMLTAKADEVDRVLGLEIGADDYVTKPFSPKEFVARVRAVLRRSRGQQQKAEKIEVGGLLTLDPGRHEVMVGGTKVEVTAVEFRILQFLASKPGWVFSRDSILDYLWGHGKVVTDRTIDVHVRHLREKLGPAAGLVKNVRGVGYKLES
jgi:DNA-binding response OmpR family regulator